MQWCLDFHPVKNSHVKYVTEHADLAFGVVALGVFVAHTVVGLEAAHGNLCVSRPIHGPLIDVS